MTVTLKPLDQQVVVLTGATSGIGLCAARCLAERGASLVLVARNDEALDELVSELSAKTEAMAVDADVGDREAVARVAREAVERFGRIDTWVNNAGVAIYGAVTDVPWEDQRRLFETNYWGLVAGSLEMVAHRRERGGPGKLINLGSALSDRAMILQGPYSASKHAVKGITDALRMELEAADEPIDITLIKPGAVDTPYMEHARSFMESEGTRNPPPSYDPDLVAQAIEHACEHHARDLDVGAGGWAVAKLGQVAPALTDQVMKLTGKALQTSSAPPRPGMRDNLYTPARDGEERSAMPGPPPKPFSLLLAMQMNPVATIAIGTAATVAAIAWMNRDERRV